MATEPNQFCVLSRRENQARGIGQYAIDFLRKGEGKPSGEVELRTEWFHTDSIACAVAALGEGAAAPTLLRQEAMGYPAADEQNGACVFGSFRKISPEKAVLANCSAVRELDSNGTNFGYNPKLGNVAGEFGHNDFYPVVIAAAQQMGMDGRGALLGMICLDEIRGRLAEVFSLKSYKIDHVLHGAIASAAVYGAMLGATAEQIESAIGLVVAHYVPFRAIRHGEQLSDSKGASAAISSEVAVQSMRRAIRGFVGPADIFRNPQALFCLFQKPDKAGESPFELSLAMAGSDFAVMGMHFKLGLYEHQSAGALGGLIQLLAESPELANSEAEIESLCVRIYEPAFGIICDPHKRNPQTRQSADHSLPYIVASVLHKAMVARSRGELATTEVELWKQLMLVPDDYSEEALQNGQIRKLMAKIELEHGGETFDARYPEGIPTEVVLTHKSLGSKTSGMVLFPIGHASGRQDVLEDLLRLKFQRLAQVGVRSPERVRGQLTGLAKLTADEIGRLYSFEIRSCSDC